ncbi:hypothetical protein BKH46_08060 [Helicobacter sp. 12S02634-8]|uniref:TraB/VirB10 family protein n=1 Tax=Helicobacter sp. 12S02634-8 TaxID=1476199 RepID=UPI000BA6A33A|nr:TraB/VirB10 family protein [Helicobacter sp. 12S02634-8]PAF46331.1 hypothetical protein BKH46_08060 [Helicobacter sp. 12S02634-8]
MGNEEKPKKSGFFGMFKIKTHTAIDEIASKDDAIKKQKSKMNKRIGILFFLMAAGFIIAVMIRAVSIYSEHENDYIDQTKRQVVEIKTDNFAIWQSAIMQKMKDEKSAVDGQFKDLNAKLESTSSFLTKELPQTLKEAFDNVGSKINDLSNQTQSIQSSVNQKIDDMSKNTDAKISALQKDFKDEIHTQIDKVNTEIKGIKEKQNTMSVTPPSIADLPTLSEDASKLPVPVEQKKEELKSYPIAFTVRPSLSAPPEEEQEGEPFFNVRAGLAQGILINGVDAAIANQGSQEDSPVYISLLTRMTIANGEYTNVKDCLLIGGAVGSFTTEAVKIRLTKISCVFSNQMGEKFVAEGNIQGWVTDENSKIGLGGQLITKEGKIIRAALPLAFLQTGFDYITRKATNVSVVGGGYTDLQAALGTGSSSAASNTISKMADIYSKYAQSLTAVVSIMGGRKVTILFKGGEKIKLEPYEDKTGREGSEMGIDMGDNQYDYVEAKGTYYEDN